jgi:parallel beta-helix repeat protein
VSDWNGKHGVILWGNSSGNSLSWIKASYNGETGVYLSFASNNTLSLAFANSNFGNGIALVGGSQSNVLSRVASNNNSNGSGVVLLQSGSNTLFKGHSSGNADGITLFLSDANNISGMSVMSSRRNGMHIAFSANNSVARNSIKESGAYGVLLNRSSWNAIFDNLLSNSQNALVTSDSGENTWSLPAPLASTNVVGGPYTGGNYWGSPDGNGYSQQCPLQFPEGICHDVYYVRGENNRDNYPLASYVQPVSCTGSACKAPAPRAQAS